MKSKIAGKVLEEMKAYIQAFKKGELKTYELLPTGKNTPPIRVGKPFLTVQALALLAGTSEEEITLYAFECKENGDPAHRVFYFTFLEFLNVVECLIVRGLALGDYNPDSIEWILTQCFHYKRERVQKLKSQAQNLHCKKDSAGTLPTKEEIFSPLTQGLMK